MFTKIEGKMWKDDKFRNATDQEKLLFIYLLTNNHRNLVGLYFIPKQYMAADLSWASQGLSNVLSNLEQKGFIKYDSTAEIVFITRFLKYNKLQNPKQVIRAIKDLRDLPQTGLMEDLRLYIEEFEDDYLEPLIACLRSIDVPEEPEATTRKKEKKEPPYEKIKELYNEICEDCRTVMKLSDKRKRHLKQRWKEYPDLKWWEEYFKKIQKSDFLTGKKTDFVADFDWVINPNNLLKIIEGRYDNRDKSGDVIDEVLGGE